MSHDEQIAQIKQMCKGNFGAVTVMQQLNCDYIKKLDELNIKGSGIWCLYKDVCNSDINCMIELLDKLMVDKTITCEIRGKNCNVLEYAQSLL